MTKENNGKETVKSVISDLMKRIGGNGQFDPIPPDQRKWQGVNSLAFNNPPLNRIWAEIFACSLGRQGGRSAYAVDESGKELSIEDIAKRLLDENGKPMDPGCARGVFRRGVELGIWRNGTKEEPGINKRRIYLCPTVFGLQATEIRRIDGEETANEKVCTNLFTPSMLKKIKDWAPEKVERVGRKLQDIEDRFGDAPAICLAAIRVLKSQEQHNAFAQEGVKLEGQKHQRKGESEDEAKARADQINFLLPVIEKLVQTSHPKVCTESETTLYKVQNGFVQTSASLLSLEKDLDLENPLRAGGSETAVTTAPPARPQVDSQSPPHQNRKAKTEDPWRADLREWLRENCPVKTVLDDVMFERIAFWLSPESLRTFREAALEVKNPKKWPIYESVAKQVAERGEVPDAPVSRKDQRRQEWEQEMLRKYGKEA